MEREILSVQGKENIKRSQALASQGKGLGIRKLGGKGCEYNLTCRVNTLEMRRELGKEGLGSPEMPSPPCGKGVWHGAREGGGGTAQDAWGPPILPRSLRAAEPRGRLAAAEAEPRRGWAWLDRAGRCSQRAALGPAGRPAGSREVDKAAAAFDVSGELILNRYKMAEGDEAARRQPQQGLRRRRQTSDSSVGVNHVSSTTSLGTGRRGRGHGDRESRRPRPLGLAGTGRRWGRRPRLAGLGSRRRVCSLAGPSPSRAPRPALRRAA